MQQWNEDARTPASPPGFCDGCGAALAAGTRFCTSCGRPQGESCASCGAALGKDDRFCMSCGRPALHDRSRIYQRKAIAGKPIARFGFRAGVYLVDSIIMSTLSNLLGQLVLRGTAGDPQALQKRLREDEPSTFAEFVDLLEPALWWALAFFVVGLALQVVWNSIGWSPAQRIIGLRIVDAEGRPPGWRRGLGRTAAAWLSALALGIGYLTATWHPEKRTWHDRIAGTWVVDVREQR